MSKIRILVVDDHKIIRDGIKSMLQNQKNFIIVGEATNGKEALESLKKLEVDLVIMDINMPQMTGVECTAKITELYKSVKVLALTMHDEELYLAKMIEAGAYGYILKDLGKDELLKAVESIASGKHYYSQEITISVIKELTSPSKKQSPLFKNPLTERELEVLELIVKEFSNQEIADKLSISIRTVDAHRRNLLEKTDSKNTAGLVKYALTNDLFTEE